MAKKQVRDSAYYEERLKRDHPFVYADLKSGKYLTVTDAAIAAGLKKVRTRLQELRNAWTKADAVEQADFLRWLAASGVALSPAPSSAGLAFAVASNRRLTPAAVLRVNEIMTKRHMQPGDLMAEMGYPKLNTSVSTALIRGRKLQPDVIVALEKWLIANCGV
ncbi:hypothetical protein GCM10011491_34690 [Brucella endophytica]|uniref:Uncharacterized protein n=1 Tax=Brucella endophytica TaxID=1963359 RepID=A0A916SKF6_9HYPH|nr:hypothetical protein [Brucella endophytica]GGB03580.1 hypothetical protein GCM10011491_34690 [Brucella endophytica]